jgi:predicted DNA-binding transcriptional regulator AlpA
MAIQDAETRGSQLLRQIIRKPVVVEFTGMSASSIDREEHRGKFPKRVVLSPKAVGWYADEVAAWINSRRRGFTEAPTRECGASQTVAG